VKVTLFKLQRLMCFFYFLVRFNSIINIHTLLLDHFLHHTPKLGTDEFALHPQHETSCDFEIQTKKDFKSKFRKRPRSLSMISLNSSDWEQHWNTNIMTENGLKTKRIKLERSDN